MSRARSWPTVPEIMARAVSVRVGGQAATYKETADGPPIKVHAATISNLVQSLRGAGWTATYRFDVTTYERPRAKEPTQ